MASRFRNNHSSNSQRRMAKEWDRLSTFIALIINIVDLKPLKLAKDGLFYNSLKNSVICFACEQETEVDSSFSSTSMGDLHKTGCAMKDYSRSSNSQNVSDNLPILHPDENFSQKVNSELHKKYCNASSVSGQRRLPTLVNDNNINSEQREILHPLEPPLLNRTLGPPVLNRTLEPSRLNNSLESERSSQRPPILNGESNKANTKSQTSKNPVFSTLRFRPLGEEQKDCKRSENELKPKVKKTTTDAKINSLTSEELEEENRKLRDGKQCTICLDEMANILLLPCAHIPCCTFCSVPLKKCPICRQHIVGTVLTQYK